MIATINRIMGANLADAGWFNFNVRTGEDTASRLRQVRHEVMVNRSDRYPLSLAVGLGRKALGVN